MRAGYRARSASPARRSPTSITGSTGADTIDGGGGADVIDAGNGNDTVTYRGTEISIDGNTGTDKLVLAAAGGITAINLSITQADQTDRRQRQRLQFRERQRRRHDHRGYDDGLVVRPTPSPPAPATTSFRATPAPT